MSHSKRMVKRVLGIDVDNRYDYILCAKKMFLANPVEYEQKVVNYHLQNIDKHSKVCSACKGACCKKAPCPFSPRDFADLSYNGLKQRIQKGDIAIQRIPYEAKYDFPIMDGTTYYLTARGIKSPISTRAYQKDTRCIMLTENGCKFDYEHRPLGGKALIPSSEGECLQFYEFELCIMEWKPYQDVLKKLYKHFRWQIWK